MQEELDDRYPILDQMMLEIVNLSVSLLNPVGLDQIKAEPSLKGMRLATHSRLSVQPVTDDEWRTVCRKGGLPDAS